MKSDKPDPLAAFRQKPGGKREPETYAAFGGKDRVERLRIRRAMNMTRSPRYLHLHDIGYDGPFGKTFTLYYDHMVVMVRGKNLQTVVLALENGTADFIQEYHPDLWEKPADGEPIIESIEVVVQGVGADDKKPQKTS
jgi:hypothetical protein